VSDSTASVTPSDLFPLSITTSAFSCAIAFSALVIFFALQQQGIDISWSGNKLPFEGLDAAGPQLKTLASGEHFGPGVGEF
jgi:hypothetical protein